MSIKGRFVQILKLIVSSLKAEFIKYATNIFCVNGTVSLGKSITF